MSRILYAAILIFVLPNLLYCGTDQDSIKQLPWDTFVINTQQELDEVKSMYKELDEVSHEDELDYLTKMYEASKRLHLDSLVCAYAYSLSTRYLDIDSIALSFFYSNEAYSYKDQFTDHIQVAWAANLLGILYSDGGDYNKALEFYLHAFELFKKIDPNYAAYPLGNISEVYERLGDIENAIKFTRETIPYSKGLEGEEFHYNYGYDCFKLSQWFEKLNKRDSADHYLAQSLFHTDQLDKDFVPNQEILFDLHRKTTELYLNRKKWPVAKKHLQIAEQYSKGKFQNDYLLLEGKYYFATDNKQRLFPLLEKLDISSPLALVEDLLRFKIEVFETYRNYEAANKVYQELQQLTQEKFSNDKKRYAVFAAAQYESLKKQEEIDNLRKQQELSELKLQKQKATRTAMIAVMCSLLLVVFLIVFLYWKKHDFNQKLQREVEHKTRYLKKLNNDLAHKNEELYQFNYIVSHDLKEPIRSIVSFSNLIKKNLHKESETIIKEYLDFVIRGGSQLHHLIEDIHEFQSIDKQEFDEESTDFLEVVEDVKTSLNAVIKEKNGIIKCSPLPEIPVSRSALFIIVKNLIENSLKYNKNPEPNNRNFRKAQRE